MNSAKLARANGHLDLAAGDLERAASRVRTLFDQLEPRMISGQLAIYEEAAKDLKGAKDYLDLAREGIDSVVRLERLYEDDHGGEDDLDEREAAGMKAELEPADEA